VLRRKTRTAAGKSRRVDHARAQGTGAAGARPSVDRNGTRRQVAIRHAVDGDSRVSLKDLDLHRLFNLRFGHADHPQSVPFPKEPCTCCFDCSRNANSSTGEPVPITSVSDAAQRVSAIFPPPGSHSDARLSSAFRDRIRRDVAVRHGGGRVTRLNERARPGTQ